MKAISQKQKIKFKQSLVLTVEKMERIAGEMFQELRSVGNSDYSGRNHFTNELSIEAREWIKRFDAEESKREKERVQKNRELQVSAKAKLTKEEIEALGI